MFIFKIIICNTFYKYTCDPYNKGLRVILKLKSFLNRSLIEVNELKKIKIK